MTTPTHETVTGPQTGQPELDALAGQNETLHVEVARLTTENQHLHGQHQAFLDRMGTRAKEVAQENGWCSVAQNLVEELGGIWPTDPRYEFTVTHTWRLRAQLADGVDPDQITESYIANSLHLYDTPSMDDDWTDCTPVETLGFEVNQYTPITE